MQLSKIGSGCRWLIGGVVSVAALLCSPMASANPAAAKLSPAEVQAIAEEGFIFGLPLVMNYAVMNAFAVNRDSGQFKAPFNQIHCEANVFTHENTAVVTPNSDTPYCILWVDLRAEPMVVSVPAVPSSRYYSVHLCDGQYVQLRLHRYANDRSRSRRFPDRGPRLERRHPGGHQEGIPFFDTAVDRHLPDPALQPGRPPRRGQGPGRLQGAATVCVPQAAAAGRCTRDRFSEDRRCDAEGQLLRLSPFRAAVRASRPGREGDSRQARQHRRRSGRTFDFKDLSPEHKAAVLQGMKEGDAKVDHAVANLGTTITGWNVGSAKGTGPTSR